MKLRLFSDLHLEFSKNRFNHIWAESEDDKETILLLAGDIGVGLGAKAFVESLCKSFKHVLFVCGNHEFYDNDMTVIRKRWLGVEDEISNFHFLDNSWRIINGVRFIGGTMWTGYNNGDPIVTSMAGRSMNDFNLILKDRFGITTNVIMKEHAEFLKSFHDKISEEFDGPTVVMTHHSPGNVQRSGYGTNLLNYAYFAELENMIGTLDKVDLWVHGHTHKSADYMINNTRVVCNPYGYHDHDVNPDFDKLITLEV